MNDNFEIPVTYKGEEHLFPASLISTGYTYKIQVNVFGKLISFEPDEERNFRAVINIDELHNADKIDKALLQEIATTLEAIVK